MACVHSVCSYAFLFSYRCYLLANHTQGLLWNKKTDYLHDFCLAVRSQRYNHLRLAVEAKSNLAWQCRLRGNRENLWQQKKRKRPRSTIFWAVVCSLWPARLALVLLRPKDTSKTPLSTLVGLLILMLMTNRWPCAQLLPPPIFLLCCYLEWIKNLFYFQLR